MNAKAARKTEGDDPPWPSPRVNPDLVGHAEAERHLAQAFASGKLAHAWLIAGPRGVGKATLAFRFARHVLKRSTADQGPGLFGALPDDPTAGLYLAPEDPVFRRVQAAGHADLLTLERTVDDKGKMRRDVVVDDVREVGSFLRLTAAEGGWRVVVVDSVDEMNRNAANAILKVLEEPPKNALLLLVAHNPGLLLPTIRSRCRMLALKPLPDDLVSAQVAKWCPELSSDDARALAMLGEGSIGRALALYREGGLELYRELNELLETLPDLDRTKLHRLCEKVGKGGGEEGAFRTVGELLTGWLARLIRFAAAGRSGPSGSLEPAADERLMARLAQAGGLERLLDVWEKMARLIERTEAVNLDRKQVTLDLFLTLGNAVRR